MSSSAMFFYGLIIDINQIKFEELSKEQSNKLKSFFLEQELYKNCRVCPYYYDNFEKRFLAIDDSISKADDDTVRTFELDYFKIDKKWNQILQEVCKEFNITYQKPSWSLVSSF